MTSRQGKILVTTVLILMLCLVGGYYMVSRIKNYHEPSNQTIILLHGYGSSANATNVLAKSIQDKTHITKRETINISKSGSYELNLVKSNSRYGAIYQFNFENRETSARQESDVLAKFLKQLRGSGVKKVSLVGHSMGATVAATTMLSHHPDNKQYPKIDKFVAIAAPFNSGMIDGKFNRTAFAKNELDGRTSKPKMQDDNYHYFEQNKNNMDIQTKIMNVMGDEGDGSDGVVTNFSSQSFKYFIKHNQAYSVLVVGGEQSQHSQVRDNPFVASQIATFISQ